MCQGMVLASSLNWKSPIFLITLLRLVVDGCTLEEEYMDPIEIDGVEIEPKLDGDDLEEVEP